VTAAVTLLARQGYEATTVGGIAAEGSAPMGSFYFHFPGGKEELVREAVREGALTADRWLRASLAESGTAADAVDRFVARHGRQLVESEFVAGCPVAGVALDLDRAAQRLRTACDWALTGWVTLLAERLRAEGRAPEEAEALALTAVAALEGSLVLCRARLSLDPLLAVAGQLRRLLEPPVLELPTT
jgi:TetR/AcrR family transcriptional repressor of lmrAB and yxaGH operons